MTPRTNSIRADLNHLHDATDWLHTNHTTYFFRLATYTRGSLPSATLQPHTTATTEPPLLTFDAADQQFRATHDRIAQHLHEARRHAETAERLMRALITPTKRPDDPDPRHCTNTSCPDDRIFTMIGRDRPQDAAGRCDACRKFHERNGRERTRRYSDILTADAAQLAE